MLMAGIQTTGIYAGLDCLCNLYCIIYYDAPTEITMFTVNHCFVSNKTVVPPLPTAWISVKNTNITRFSYDFNQITISF